MSHALLLRLFQASEFFSVHVALKYLNEYPDNIGITYYLTARLAEHTVDDLRDVWGFICHLLVARPSRSRALECFVAETSRRSTHVALLTLWFMQAALRDLSATPQSPQARICQRTLRAVHELIFSDLPAPARTPYPSLLPSARALFTRRKVRANPAPALVGLGMLAGALAHPKLASIVGPVAVEQGRAEAEAGAMAREEDDVAHSAPASTASLASEHGDSDDDSDASDAATPAAATPPKPPRSPRRHSAASTSPSLPLHLARAARPRKPRFSDDPLGQLDQDQALAARSTPALSSARHTPRTPSSLNENEALLARYAPDAQRELLRRHFCRAEVQFVLALESISDRLLVVPKPARVSALRAELTALNHKLPADVCMPLWCTATSDAAPGSTPHHRIVRIPPGECVVLNSAERAPYLLLVEILHGDLDFDPTARANRTQLSKLAAADSGTGRADALSFAPTPAPSLSRGHSFALPRPGASASASALGIESQEGPPTTPIAPASAAPPTPAPEDGEEEEIDLVEQLYGSDGPLNSRAIDLADNVVLPPAPKNRDLDLAAWARADAQTGAPAPAPVSVPVPERTSSSIRRPAELSLQDYSDRMRTAAVMLAQLNANLAPDAAPAPAPAAPEASGVRAWLGGGSWFSVEAPPTPPPPPKAEHAAPGDAPRMRLAAADAAAIRERIMDEMLALEEARMERMRERAGAADLGRGALAGGGAGAARTTAEDEGVIRRALTRSDPSALVFAESWAAKRARVKAASPYGHLAAWDCASAIVKTGGDLRQEQLACALVLEFARIWADEGCGCYARPFRILITGAASGLIETVTDAVSVHSIKKAEYARRLATGAGHLGHVTLLDHFKNTYGDPSSAKFARAQRNFAKSLAGYSVITYLLQIKDRHNGNILLDRDGHIVHIDWGFMLANSPGNMGFEAAPFKLPLEYVDVLGGLAGAPFAEFRALFRAGFAAARKHCERVVTVVELMQHDSALPCFAAFGEQTAQMLRERFQLRLTQAAVEEHVERLIDTSLGSHWTRLYDSYQYYSQSIL